MGTLWIENYQCKHIYCYLWRQPRTSSGVVDVFVVVSELPSQLLHNLLEDHSVDVQSHHVEKEKVSHFGLFNDDVDTLSLDESEAKVEQVGSDLGGQHDEDPVQYHQRSQAAEDQEPKPKEDVDFLIN